MTPLDPDIQDCKALVIDGNPTSRSTLVAMLRDWGLGTVVQTGRPEEARKALENRVFDIVLCEQHFDHRAAGGQELLDELRRAQLLPFSTVFIMVTGEASYAKVAEAAESALDSYLLKPHTAEVLGDRLRQARRRKRVLREIFEAIESNDFALAARLCMQRFAVRGEYWLYAARIGAELLLRVGDHESARKLYEAVRETNALPWAKLGIARTYVEAGDTPQAKRTLDSLISDNPGYADAYDVMGRVQIEHGDLAGALETYRRACDLTPGSVSRLQKAGMIAFYSGDVAEAERSLDRATLLGISSKMFDRQTLVLQALMKFDRGDTRNLSRSIDNIKHLKDKFPEDRRLQRFHEVVDVLQALVDKQLAQVVRKVKDLVAEIVDDDFDFEAAGNLLSLLVRILTNEVALPDGELWVERIARRFCVSRAAADMLCGLAMRVPVYQQLIRDAHGVVNTMAEEAMTHTVRGDPDTAVRLLLDMGQQTLNAKLIELADKVLQRHESRIADGPELVSRCNSLNLRYGTQGTRINLNEVGRSAGAVALR
ncbi:MAG: tetratricopeptide repeat protein [Burkholderiales bacterium]